MSWLLNLPNIQLKWVKSWFGRLKKSDLADRSLKDECARWDGDFFCFSSTVFFGWKVWKRNCQKKHSLQKATRHFRTPILDYQKFWFFFTPFTDSYMGMISLPYITSCCLLPAVCCASIAALQQHTHQLNSSSHSFQIFVERKRCRLRSNFRFH